MLVALTSGARFVKGLLQSASSRYQKLSLIGKVTSDNVVFSCQLTMLLQALIWFILFFYLCSAAIIVVVTPARIAQFTYDFAQDIRHLPYGYTILIIIMSKCTSSNEFKHANSPQSLYPSPLLLDILRSSTCSVSRTVCEAFSLQHLDHWQALQ